MKKIILVLLLALSASIYAQSKHELSLYGGGGLSTLLYKSIPSGDDDWGKGTGGLGGLGYTYFFSEYFGLGFGPELAFYRNDGKRDLGYGKMEKVHPQRIRILQIPLMAQLQIGDMHKFFFGAGFKTGIPVNVLWLKFEVEGEDLKDRLRPPVFLASAETGMKWQLKNQLYLYTGAYFDYGLNNIINKRDFIDLNERQGSDYKKILPFAAGLKLKLAFGSGSMIEPPHLKFSVAADSITTGESTDLKWIAVNADEASIQGIGTVPVEGTVKVSPTETTRYTIIVKGRGGEKTESVVVAVKSAPPPSVVFTVSPKTIQAGQTATLNWMVSNAEEVSIEGTGPVPEKGTAEIKPSETVRYTLVAKGKGGSRTETVELVVEAPPGPAIIFNSVPATIQRGQVSTLNWITTDAEEVSIEGIGNVPDKGTREVKPSQTTKYTLTAKGKGITRTQEATITVEDPPPVEEKVNLKGVNFLSGKSVLSLDSKKVLDGVAEQLLTYPNVKIEIQGHTDNVGKAATNQKLSENRAKAVVNYLVSKGVKMSRIRAVGHGSSLPIADNSTEEGRELNRRIEMIRIDN